MPSRNFLVLTILSCTIIPLFAGVLFVNQSASASTLYCVSDPVTYSITTQNESTPHAACFRVQGGIFTEVLAKRPTLSFEKVIYLNGHVLPGLMDGHGHILQYGEMLESVSLYGTESIKEVRNKIQTFLKLHEGEGYGTRSKWVRGIGWDQAFFDGVMPTAEDLNLGELKGLYIMLDRVDVHCVWVSNSVLSLLPDPLPTAPPGGVIVTEPGKGVFCDNAMDAIIYPEVPKPDVAQKTRWFRKAMEELNKVGIVGVGDAGMRPEDVQILESLAESGELSIRISVMLECAERNIFCPEETEALKLVNEKALGSDALMLGGVKLFADGALGSWGSAMLEPFSDKMETSGTMLINETELNTVVRDWYNAGFQVNVHAIGDRANRAAVDAFENVLGKECDGCNTEYRLRIEHAQIIHPDDQTRISKMGIIPSIQPTHATSDMAYALSRLGPDRLNKSAYRMSSLFSSDPSPVLGSDFPVEPPNPFHGMYAAVTRLSPATGSSPSGSGGWYPEEKLSIEQALSGFTKNVAYGWFKEARGGAIDVGKWADWVVVNTDVLADKSGEALRDVKVMETWMGGRRVYSDNERPVQGNSIGEKLRDLVSIVAQRLEL